MKNSNWIILAVLAIAGIGVYYFFSEKQKNDSQKIEENLLRATRNNWHSYVFIKQTQYKFSSLGGIESFDVPVQNNTDYLIDEVIVAVDYIKTSGETYKTENLTINNIPPHSVKTGRAPDSPRGTSIRANIIEAISRSMHFCFPSGSGGFSDQYFCK
jgi:hypothetical protein